MVICKCLKACIYTCKRGAFVCKRSMQEMLPFLLENGCNSWEEEGVLSQKIRSYRFSRLSRKFSRLKIYREIFRNAFSRLHSKFSRLKLCMFVILCQFQSTGHACSVDWTIKVCIVNMWIKMKFYECVLVVVQISWG